MIFISLTTVPKRLIEWELVQRNLTSLLTQKTDKEYFVIYNVPYVYKLDDNAEYIIPDELIEFSKNYPNLIINRDTPDYGPILKIVGALLYATEPNDIIIALDDDEVYHEDMLEYHYKKINEHPNHVICFDADYPPLDKRDWIEDGVKKYIYRPGCLSFPANRDTYVVIPGHSHSVGYRRSFFKEDFNEELWGMADGDDPLIGYYARIHEVPILCVKWDKETDFRVINDPIGNKPCYHFPVIGQLPSSRISGGWLIREKFGQLPGSHTTHGRMTPIIHKTLYDTWDKIYIEKEQ